jgi:hypothetical protein
MIEISKYLGPRLFVAIDRMEKQAKEMGIDDDFPHLDQAATNLKRYFEELYALRKGAISPLTLERGISELAKNNDLSEEVQSALRGCKTREEAEAVLKPLMIKKEDQLKFMNFFPAKTGGIPPEQKVMLEKEIAEFHKIMQNEKEETDVGDISKQLSQYVSSINAWCGKQSPETRLSISKE